MKRILKFLFTLIFVISSFFALNKLTQYFTNDALIFIVLSFTLFAIFLFAWIAPRTFFDVCWRITNIIPDHFDYESSYRNLEFVSFGLLATAYILLIIVFLII